MIKHQRRSHIKRSGSEEDETSDSDSDESSSTTQYSAQVKQQENILQYPVMPDNHRGHSFGGSEQQQDTFPFPKGLYYVPEQSNPHVATLKTGVPSLQGPHHQLHHQLSQETIQSSPSSCSSTSRASPVPQEAIYAQHPSQLATHALLFQCSPIQQPIFYPRQTGQAVTQPNWCEGFACQQVGTTSNIYPFYQHNGGFDQISRNKTIESLGSAFTMPSVRIETL
jgi:hypothetical protein